MTLRSKRLALLLFLSSSCLGCRGGSGSSSTDPQLVDPAVGTLELVTASPAQQAQLDRIDGLAFDSFGNLFGALEIPGAAGGVVYVDKQTGDVTPLVSGIACADQVALQASGDFFVTSETSPQSTTNRVYRLTVGYDAGDVPSASTTTAASVTTSLPIDNPEGLIVLDADGAYGTTGDLYVCEDRGGGGVYRVVPSTGATTLLVDGLNRPEGLAFGDFGGTTAPGLYAATTNTDQVVLLETDGSVTVVGDPAAVNLENPDNLEFGPDGCLYVAEDRPGPSSRILRIAPDGTYSVFATGFGQAAGMTFDPANGDLYISEQDFDRIWRVRFAVSVPQSFLILGHSPEPGAFSAGGHVWPTQISDLSQVVPVTPPDLPAFVFQVDPARSQPRRQAGVAATFFAELLLWTPSAFGGNAEPCSTALSVTLWSDGSATAVRSGMPDGNPIRLETFTGADGVCFVRFPFPIE